jgi:hypothetical protein
MGQSSDSKLKKATNTQGEMYLNMNIISPPVTNTYGNKNDIVNHPLITFHQNMEGLKGKIDEFVLTLVSEMPHLVCLTEHHLNYNKIDMVQIPNYKLAAKYCRTSLKRGGVCIYIYKKI